MRISPLSGIGRVEDEVEGRDPVAGHHQQAPVGQLVEVAHLAGVEVRGALDGGSRRRIVMGPRLPSRSGLLGQYLMSNAVAPVGRGLDHGHVADRAYDGPWRHHATIASTAASSPST